jgi:hypothetical protein
MGPYFLGWDTWVETLLFGVGISVLEFDVVVFWVFVNLLPQLVLSYASNSDLSLHAYLSAVILLNISEQSLKMWRPPSQ